METLTLFILWTVFSGIFLGLSKFFYSKYNNYNNPSRDSELFYQRFTFYNEVYSNKIEPIFRNYIIQYFLNFSNDLVNFKILGDFINQIKEKLVALDSVEMEINEKELEIYQKKIKKTINDLILNSNTYEVVNTELKLKTIKKWIKCFDEISNFIKCIKNFKILLYTSIIYFSIFTVLLIIFSFQADQLLMIIIYLTLLCICFILLAIFCIYFYLRNLKYVNYIIKTNYNPDIIPK